MNRQALILGHGFGQLVLKHALGSSDRLFVALTVFVEVHLCEPCAELLCKFRVPLKITQVIFIKHIKRNALCAELVLVGNNLGIRLAIKAIYEEA